jgi:hypothetical protein
VRSWCCALSIEERSTDPADKRATLTGASHEPRINERRSNAADPGASYGLSARAFLTDSVHGRGERA